MSEMEMSGGEMSGVPQVILASASPARRSLLENAGVPFEAQAAPVDENDVKQALKAEGAPVAAVAETLAELKALHISRRSPTALVIGADQILECEGVWFDKPVDLAAARAQLQALSGKTHTLLASVCVVRGGERLWHHNASARLQMREVSEAFLDGYMNSVGEAALVSVGAYQLEGLGAQLFARVQGDYFTILGLPLLPLLDFLRNHGVLQR